MSEDRKPEPRPKVAGVVSDAFFDDLLRLADLPLLQREVIPSRVTRRLKAND